MRHAAWVIPPFLMIVVLLWSGAAKLGNGASLRSIISNLRLPSWILPFPLARAMPGLEIVIAVGLASPWLLTYTAAAALCVALFLVYWGLIARGLTISPRPSCGCFGQAGDHTVSWRTLVRNTLLVAAATSSLALGASGRTTWALTSDFGTDEVLWLLFAGLASIVIFLIASPPARARIPGTGALARLVRGIRQRSSRNVRQHAASDPAQGAWPEDGPSADDDYVRAPTPNAVLLDSKGTPFSLLELSAERPQLLVFVDCYCSSTLALGEHVPVWAERLGVVDVRLVFSTPYDSTRLDVPPPNVLLDHSAVTWQHLGLAVSPTALLLGADRYLAGGPVAGLDEVIAFVEEIETELVSAAGPVAVTSDR